MSIRDALRLRAGQIVSVVDNNIRKPAIVLQVEYNQYNVIVKLKQNGDLFVDEGNGKTMKRILQHEGSIADEIYKSQK